ncbi:hypothetical protein [Thalassobacillus pellis]|uniref:hypothetical protein n=1 Tax=Thalassobacillus pellis TaxID=748008 RepID=UPI001962060B|nr:hypothetical protein [Thalassobacillus pellis]MBM7552963.1 hypothetical protein [Thalassobacillus pellis]
MKETTDYVEFYPRRHILIGTKDKNVLHSKFWRGQHVLDTHWVVVVKGKEMWENKLSWKVMLLTAKENGCYDACARPINETGTLTFHEALGMVRRWEDKLYTDRWFDREES